MVIVKEYNFDGLVGPTHNYSGLSEGNLASTNYKNSTSDPRKAALQGLEQMQFIFDITGNVGFIPPHIRPNFELLHAYGFGTDEKKALENAYKHSPRILAAAWSASAMWAANAATVTYEQRGMTHITPANLKTMVHRHQEVLQTAKNLKKIFIDPQFYQHHSAVEYPDEGAANHMRVGDYDIFVYSACHTHYPARQSEQASRQITFLHKCRHAIYLEQSAQAINAGAFHNDVVAVSHQNILIYHQHAFSDDTILPNDIIKIKIPDNMLSLADAIKTYLFNSRIIQKSEEEWILIAPIEAADNSSAQNAVNFIFEQGSPLKTIHYMDLRQSMSNGGGPACLRLRVPVASRESVNSSFLLSQEKIIQLKRFVQHNYRDRIDPRDLADIHFATEVLDVVDRMSQLFF